MATRYFVTYDLEGEKGNDFTRDKEKPFDWLIRARAEFEKVVLLSWEKLEFSNKDDILFDYYYKEIDDLKLKNDDLTESGG